MARKDKLPNIALFDEPLYSEGFINNETALDEDNLNQLVDGILLNRQEIINLSSDVSQNREKISTNEQELSNLSKLYKLIDTDVIEKTPVLGLVKDGKKYYLGEGIGYPTEYYESGTVFTPKYRLEVNGGKYKYGPDPTGALLVEGSIKVSDVTNPYDDETTVTVTPVDGSQVLFDVTFDSPIVISEDTEHKYYFNCETTDGNLPVNNVGEECPEKIIKGTHLQSLISIVKGYRMGCFYGTISTDNTKDTITSDIIRGLNKSNKSYTSGNLTMEIPVGTKAILIACPKESIGPSNVLNTTVNAKMTELFGTDKIVRTMVVKGSGEDIGEEYNVWMYKPSLPYESSASLTITLG